METVSNSRLRKFQSTLPFKEMGARKLPSWEELRDEAYSIATSSTFPHEIANLRSRPKPFLLKFMRILLFVGFKDPSYRKFLGSSWEEIIDIIATQFAENSYIAANYDLKLEELSPFLGENSDNINRSYMQQPCTMLTVKQRANFVESITRKNDAILLLGDDDMVGLELASRGFKQVTVVDIDTELINRIRKQAQKCQLNINLYEQDLSEDIPFELTARDYAFVILDPFYSTEGVQLFLKGAQKITANSKSPCFFLCLHLLSLMKKGLDEFGNIIEDLNLELTDIYRSFNLYPVPVKTQRTISIVNKLLTKSNTLDKNGLSFFTSDALVLRNRSNNERHSTPNKG